MMSLLYVVPVLMYASGAAAKGQAAGVEVTLYTRYLLFVVVGVSALLIKPLTLIPAIMIGKDKMILESMVESKTHRLRDARRVMLLFAAWICFLPVMPMLSLIS